MYIKLIFKLTINNKQIYPPRLYKYRDSYVLYILTVHAFGSVNFTHTLLVQTHTHMTFPPPGANSSDPFCKDGNTQLAKQ